jgi:hypothetical protein
VRKDFLKKAFQLDILEHSEERPNKCSTYLEEFSQKNHLTTHILIVT